MNEAKVKVDENYMSLLKPQITNLESKRNHLEESEFKSMLLDSTLDSVFVTDLKGKIIYVNESAYVSRGYSKNELMSLTLDKLAVPKYAKLLKERLDFLKITDMAAFESAHFRKDGTIMPVEVCARIIEFKEKQFVLLNVRDVTERKQIEERMRDSEKRLRDITSSLGEGVYVLDEKGLLIFMNPEAERLLGWTEPELRGKNMHNVIHNSRANSQDCPLHKVIQTGGTYRVEDDVFTCKNGDTISVSYVASPIIKDGKIVAAVAAFQDISERKKAEVAKQSLKKLKRTFEGTVSALASMVEKRDPYTAGHQKRVSQIACAIAVEMKLSKEQIEGIRIAGLLHDVGKISVPIEILAKPGRITEIEFSIVKEHSKHGYEILSTVEFPWPVAEIVLQHHERINGTGYPSGLSGQDILLEAKILAVADVVEAMVSHRPYRPALGKDKILEELSQNRGILYDPEAVDACIGFLADIGSMPI